MTRTFGMWICRAAVLAATLLVPGSAPGAAQAAKPAPATARAGNPIRVVIWDEQQPAQKTVYPNFLGNHIGEYLTKSNASRGPKDREIAVKTVRLDDPENGLPKSVLDDCDVLIWWGHQRHADVPDALAREIVRRVQDGKLQFIALHSAHWSKPFIEAMEQRSVMDAVKALPAGQRSTATVIRIPGDRRLMDPKEKLTPYYTITTGASGIPTVTVKLPSCVFPVVAADGKPGHITTLLPKHPIAKGIPAKFDIPQTEMYGGPFHVPTPDAMIFEEKWDTGNSFPSGDVWSLGKGTIFYFRPGHETFPVFKQPETLKIVENAVRWLADVKK